VPIAVALALFTVWSNSFVAAGYLLGGEAAPARFDWVTLTAARFGTAGLLCAVYCLLLRFDESRRVVRRHWRRLVVCGLLAVPIYNFGLFYAQEHGVAAPVASLVTSLLPLFVLVLSVLFLGEQFTARKITGLAIAIVGMVLVASAREGELEVAYPALIVVATVAPLSWSLFSVLSKPVAGEVSPALWSFLTIAFGGVTLVPLVPRAVPRMAGLDGPGWLALLYLVIPCAILGAAVWTWLLRHLPASSVGFTVFLNPPMTTLSKALLAVLLPATFAFVIRPQEWLGGLVALTGMAVALGIGAPRVDRRN
jgi:drug/metabolite transporter (DMT)-like permease